jgi:hypothetical protein
MNAPLFIRALGLATPAPGDQRQQVAALLCGAPLFQRHPRWVGADGQRQIMGFVPELRDLADFPARVAGLLHRAFVDCIADQEARHGAVEEAPLIVLLPAILRRSVFQDAFRETCAQLDFSRVSGVDLHFGGAPGALSLIRQMGQHDRLPRAYIAAADSLVTPFMLDYLAAQGLLRDRLSPWNAIPSEGAACLLMSRDPGPAQVLACATGQETQSLSDPGRGLLGRALCAAVDQVLSPAMAGISEVFSDSTVERWRSEELGVLRSERPLLSAKGVSWRYITQRTGEMGAATGLISMAAACHQEARSLILSSDRSGDRAAAVCLPAQV